MLIRNIVIASLLGISLLFPQDENLNKTESVPQTILFSGVTGKALRDSLVHHYKPTTVLNYNNARDKMFGEIYNVSTQVTCVYTGWTITIDPNSPTAPRTQAHNLDCNTEHTYPQSKGALSGNAQSDLHHLFPVRADVNSSRGNNPYAEIPVNEVNRWWRLDENTTTTPVSNIDEYSRTGTGKFQVRDDHKGNAARAVFYFYTMYQTEAHNADPNFFALQVNDLILWHKQDLVNQIESDRTYAKAVFQNNKVNPYIIDTTLARRAYGIEPPQQFAAVSVSGTQINLSWESNLSDDDVIIVFNQSGVFNDPVDGVTYNHNQSGLNGTIIKPNSGNTTFNHTGLSSGTYYYKIFSYNSASERFSVGYVREATTGIPAVLHYWNFNDPPGANWGSNPINATSTIGGGVITHNFNPVPQSFNGTTTNNENNDLAGSAFCPQGGTSLVNNGKSIIIDLPTTNYENIILSYAAQRTTTGFTTQTISYSLDGTFNDEVVIEAFTSILTSFEIKSISFVNVSGAEHNPNFKVKVTFTGATDANGNNRIDNLKITGTLILTRDIIAAGNSLSNESLTEALDNKSFFSFGLRSDDGAINFTSINLTIEGTYSSSYIAGFKLWESFNSAFDVTEAEQIGSTLQSNSSNGEVLTFYGFSDEVTSTTKYYYVTVDIDASASNGSQLCGKILNFEALTFNYPAASHSSNLFPIEGNNTPLPVELTSFTATVNSNGNVQLLWSTATELNNYGFEIERFRQNETTPLPEWEKIGFVKGAGTKNSETNYIFIDTEKILSGKYFYRLKQIDIDGEYTYSEKVEVTIGIPDKYELYQNYPNPFNPSTILKYSIPEDNFVTLKVYDITGRVVQTIFNNEWHTAGIYDYDFSKSGNHSFELSSGVYFYRLQSGDFNKVMKMVLLR